MSVNLIFGMSFYLMLMKIKCSFYVPMIVMDVYTEVFSMAVVFSNDDALYVVDVLSEM